MIPPRFQCVLSILLCAQSLFAQFDIPQPPLKATFYYNLNWELTTPEKSFYKRIAYFDFINMVFDGLYRDYNKQDVLIAEGSYAHGVKGGFHSEYFNNRSLKSSIEYQGNYFTVWEFHDELKMDSVRRGTGRFSLTYFYLSGLVAQPTWKQGVLNGEVRMGQRAGTWTYHDINKKQTDEEFYENGKLIKRIHFSDPATVELAYSKEIIISINSLFTESLAYDHDSFTQLNQVVEQQIGYPSTFNRTATYPGGIKRLLLLLAQYAEVPEGNVSILKLRVDEHGTVLKYSIQASAGPDLDQKAIKALKSYENKLLPAVKDGIPYPSTIYLPISGGEYWVDFLNTTPIEDILSMR